MSSFVLATSKDLPFKLTCGSVIFWLHYFMLFGEVILFGHIFVWALCSEGNYVLD